MILDLRFSNHWSLQPALLPALEQGRALVPTALAWGPVPTRVLALALALALAPEPVQVQVLARCRHTPAPEAR